MVIKKEVLNVIMYNLEKYITPCHFISSRIFLFMEMIIANEYDVRFQVISDHFGGFHGILSDFR